MCFKYQFIVHPYLIDFIVSIVNELSEIPRNVIMIQFVKLYHHFKSMRPIVYTPYCNYSENLRKFNYRIYTYT